MLALIVMVVVFAPAIAARRSTTAHASNVVTQTGLTQQSGRHANCQASPQSSLEMCREPVNGHDITALKRAAKH